jgi:hypothetical protein
MLEIGKTYSFKTLTFYYIGTVIHMYPTHAVLKDVHEVFETGPNDEYYAGKVKNKERCPDGVMVPIGPGTIITPYSWVAQAA